jgi:hypothetical protein
VFLQTQVAIDDGGQLVDPGQAFSGPRAAAAGGHLRAKRVDRPAERAVAGLRLAADFAQVRRSTVRRRPVRHADPRSPRYGSPRGCP